MKVRETIHQTVSQQQTRLAKTDGQTDGQTDRLTDGQTPLREREAGVGPAPPEKSPLTLTCPARLMGGRPFLLPPDAAPAAPFRFLRLLGGRWLSAGGGGGGGGQTGGRGDGGSYMCTLANGL